MNRGDIKWLDRMLPDLTGKRVLDVGGGHSDSKQVRELIGRKGGQYISVDMNTKADVCHNMNEPLTGYDHFDVVICLSTLEHCDKPWKVAENIEGVMKPGALLLVSAPYIWRQHSYPNDYFRYLPDGFRALFCNIEFSELFTDPKIALDVHTKADKIQSYGVGRKVG